MPYLNISIFIASITLFFQSLLIIGLIRRQTNQNKQANELHHQLQTALTKQIHQLQLELQQSYQTSQYNLHEKISQSQLKNQQLITETVAGQMKDVRNQMQHSFQQHADALTKHL